MKNISFLDQDGQPVELEIRQDGGAVGWVKPGKRTRFAIRGQWIGLRIDKLEIEDGGDWRVNDIRVHGKSQLSYNAACGDVIEEDGIPGDMFATNAIDTLVRFDTLQTRMTLAIDVTYVGKNPEGQPLALVAHCTVC